MKKWKTIISPNTGLFDFNLKEVWLYRDLCTTFIRKNYITRYKQTVFGPLYMILSPLLTSGIFTVVFGTIAGISTSGIPEFLFYMSGNLVWGYFSTGVWENNSIFSSNAYIMGKVYFPRLVIPLANTLTRMIDLLVQLILFVVFYFIFQARGMEFNPTAWVIAVPFLLILLVVLGAGIGLIFSSLTVKYRDLNVMLGFGMKLLMYASPVIYPLSNLSEGWQKVALFNPAAAVIEVFRYGFFGIGRISVPALVWALALTVIIYLTGLVLFNRVEKTFIDTI